MKRDLHNARLDWAGHIERAKDHKSTDIFTSSS